MCIIFFEMTLRERHVLNHLIKICPVDPVEYLIRIFTPGGGVQRSAHKIVDPGKKTLSNYMGPPIAGSKPIAQRQGSPAFTLLSII